MTWISIRTKSRTSRATLNMRIVLKELRLKLAERVKSLPDLSFYPETVLVEKAVANPIAFGNEHKDEIAKLVDIADLSLKPWSAAQPKLDEALKSKNPWERYWAAIACGTFGEQAAPLVNDVKKLTR